MHFDNHVPVTELLAVESSPHLYHITNHSALTGAGFKMMLRKEEADVTNGIVTGDCQWPKMIKLMTGTRLDLLLLSFLFYLALGFL